DELAPEPLFDAGDLDEIAVGEREAAELVGVALLLGENALQGLLQVFVAREAEVFGIDREDAALDRPADSGIVQAFAVGQRRDRPVQALEIAPPGFGVAAVLP